MQTLRKVIDNKVIGLQIKMNQMLRKEQGDTNFISIVIVLAIVAIVATVFIGLKDTLVSKAQGEVDSFAGSSW